MVPNVAHLKGKNSYISVCAYNTTLSDLN